MRKILLVVLAASPLWAQRDTNHVQWTFEAPASATPGAEVVGKLTGTVDAGWHLYSITTPPAPIPTSIKLKEDPAVASLTVYQPKPERKFDPNFNAETETYTEKVAFLLRIKFTNAASGQVNLVARPRYQVCSATQCIPPVTKEVAAQINIAPGAAATPVSIPSGYFEARPGVSQPAGSSEADTSLFAFLGVAFGFGLA